VASMDQRKTRDLVWLGAGGGVGLLVLVVALFWPNLLHPHWGMDFAVDAPDPNAFVVVTADNRQVIKDLGAAEWVDAEKESLRQGDVHVRVAWARVDVPPAKKQTKGLPKALLVQVQVVNTGQLRLIPYPGLG